MNKLIESLIGIAGNAQFASFTYQTKSTGEIARYNVILGADYLNLLEKSLTECQLLQFVEIEQLSADAFLTAKIAVLKSLEKSIAARKIGQQNEDYTKAGLYQPICQGLSVNMNDYSLQLFGLLWNKVTLVSGEYKKVNSAPETIAKNLIREKLSINRFREFALENITGARLDGKVMIFENNLGEKYDKIKVEKNTEHLFPIEKLNRQITDAL